MTDQLGDQITLTSMPKRIVSLVPSQTELLSDLGLYEEVIGITKFCVHPESWRKEKAIVGGTKNFSFESIDALRPDLIIGNKEENYREGILQLKKKYPVWMSDVKALPDAIRMIKSIATLTGRQQRGDELCGEIELNFGSLAGTANKSVLYLIWNRPWMAAGAGTFIHSMLQYMGLTNVVSASRYPDLDDAQIKALSPQLVFLSSEPYPFRDDHAEYLQQLLPSSIILRVDGEMFSWYGSRLRLAPAYFKSLVGLLR